MKGKQPGSSIVLFLIVMFGLVVAITQVWRVIAYSVDVTISRQLSYQALYCTEGIRVWAVAFVENNFETLCKDLHDRKKPLLLELKGWPIEVPLLSGAICTASIQRTSEYEFKVTVMCKHTNASCSTMCFVRKHQKNKESKESFSVSNWSIVKANV